MPRARSPGKGASDRFNIRLDPETAAYYRKRANENGISVAEYLRQLLVQGVIAENVQEIELRLKAAVAQINATSASAGQAQIPEELAFSILLSEQLLIAIVEARDIQQIYAAQDRVKGKLKQIRA